MTMPGEFSLLFLFIPWHCFVLSAVASHAMMRLCQAMTAFDETIMTEFMHRIPMYVMMVIAGHVKATSARNACQIVAFVFVWAIRWERRGR